MDRETELKRFMLLFQGNERSHGRYDPSTKKMVTLESAASQEDFDYHLGGRVGLGVVPITDDGTCYFAAIDIDNHKGEAIDHKGIANQIKQADLPLTVCRSKSGGAHVYLFGSEPLQTKLVRSIMAKWSADLGYPGAEIFPKQSYLRLNTDGSRALGNWINLPYFAAHNTERYGVEHTGKADLDFFILQAESRLIKNEYLNTYYSQEHPDAPPCIQRIMAQEAGTGHRNEALYNMAIYLKRAFPQGYRNMAFDMNIKCFDKPLEHSEASKTISSATRRDYRYRCGEQPIKGFCDRATCLNRAFGITERDATNLDNIENMPEFTDLKKFNVEPVRWELSVGDKPIILSTKQLEKFPELKRRVLEEMMVVLPTVPQPQWERTLTALVLDCQVIDAPDEASTTGVIRAKLQEFLNRADLDSDGTDMEDREALLRGQPVVQVFGKEKEKCILFRGTDFVEHLKRTRSEELKGTELWFAVRKSGVKHGRVRIGDRVHNVWRVPFDKGAVKLAAIDFDPGF